MVVVCVIALQAIGMGNSPLAGDPGYGFVSAEKALQPDTIRYRNQFIGNVTGTQAVGQSAILRFSPDNTVYHCLHHK